MSHAIYLRGVLIIMFSYCSEAIVDKDENNSEDENTAKRKPRVAGPLEIVRDMSYVS